MRLIAVAAFAATCVVPTLSHAQSAVSLEIMEELARGGCVVTREREDEFVAAIEARGMRPNVVGEELLGAGLLQLQGDALVIVGGSCANQTEGLPPPPEALVATLAAIRDNGCMISEGQADAALGPLGPREEIMGHLANLDDLNFVRIMRAWGGVVASDRVCTATDETLVSFAQQVPEMLNLSSLNRLDFIGSVPGARALLLQSSVEADCGPLAPDYLRGMFDLGFDNASELVERPLLEAGLLEEDARIILRASAAYCAASPAERRAMVGALE